LSSKKVRPSLAHLDVGAVGLEQNLAEEGSKELVEDGVEAADARLQRVPDGVHAGGEEVALNLEGLLVLEVLVLVDVRLSLALDELIPAPSEAKRSEARRVINEGLRAVSEQK